MSARITVCGRIHLGPCLVNGGQLRNPVCMSCGEDITEEQRAQINRTWDKVHAMLSKHREKSR